MLDGIKATGPSRAGSAAHFQVGGRGASYRLAPGPPRQARQRHTQAFAIARDFGIPLEEARALEGIGQAHLQDGNRSDGQAHLRQALAIYQRIGAPAVLRVKDTLRQHRL
jgi:hypothetical protein